MNQLGDFGRYAKKEKIIAGPSVAILITPETKVVVFNEIQKLTTDIEKNDFWIEEKRMVGLAL